LAKRGWPNCGMCPLCKCCIESADHLFVHCRFTLRLWNKAKEWLGLHTLSTNNWADLSFPEWWNMSTSDNGRRGLATFFMLVI
jgi:hypothetical protein